MKKQFKLGDILEQKVWNGNKKIIILSQQKQVDSWNECGFATKRLNKREARKVYNQLLDVIIDETKKLNLIEKNYGFVETTLTPYM